MFYARTTKNPDKSDWQHLKDHLTNVAKLSQEFADDFNAGELAYASGLLHDLGKYSPEFQIRLEGAHIHVDHATAGAIEAGKLFPELYRLIFAYAVSGHHGGLLNYGSRESGLGERLQKINLPDYSSYHNEITIPDQNKCHLVLKPFPKKTGFCINTSHPSRVCG
jgi:CRISPR-associated endonuclease/helicase Cas3/CRISPR-associated endonuclease Cas3-HD